MSTLNHPPIKTDFSQLMNIDYPIIGAPMFLVSNEKMVSEVSQFGGIGSFPALNYRPIENYDKTLKKMRKQTQKPIGVNIIVNKSNARQKDDLNFALKHGVDLFITSLGNPNEVIRQAHQNGAKVICDVTNLDHALKVQDLGADGVIAVSTGAGGHAGPLSPFALIPWLKHNLQIPVIAAGGIGDGATFLSALALGADGVSVGTRFIACKEAGIDPAYKKAIVDSAPEDIVLTEKVSGTPASVINTEYVKKSGLTLPWYMKTLKNNSYTKKYVVPLIHFMGMKSLEQAAQRPTWKTVWSAGQTVGLVDDIKTCKEIMELLVSGYYERLKQLELQ